MNKYGSRTFPMVCVSMQHLIETYMFATFSVFFFPTSDLTPPRCLTITVFQGIAWPLLAIWALDSTAVVDVFFWKAKLQIYQAVVVFLSFINVFLFFKFDCVVSGTLSLHSLSLPPPISFLCSPHHPVGIHTPVSGCPPSSSCCTFSLSANSLAISCAAQPGIFFSVYDEGGLCKNIALLWLLLKRVCFLL